MLRREENTLALMTHFPYKKKSIRTGRGLSVSFSSDPGDFTCEGCGRRPGTDYGQVNGLRAATEAPAVTLTHAFAVDPGM